VIRCGWWAPCHELFGLVHPAAGAGGLLFVLLTLAGLLAFKAMKVQNMPDVDLPVVSIGLAMPGATPAQLETDVVRKVEAAVAVIPGLKNTTATIVEGAAVVTGEFRLEKGIQEAMADVRDVLSRVRGDLPADMREPVVTRLELAAMPVLTYTATSAAMDDESLSWFIDQVLSRALREVPGVGAVTRVGGVQREVRVELDPQRLMALGVSAAQVSRQLRMVQQDAAAGRSHVGNSEQSLRVTGSVSSAADLAKLDIALQDGRRIRLGDLAQVFDTVAEQRSAALLNGQPAVAFEISRTRGASQIEVAAGVRRALDRVRTLHPGVEFTQAFDFVKPVQQNFEASMQLLVEGALLAVVVVWIFLRDWRATWIAAVALPLSVIPTFAAVHLLGFTLNALTLLALTLVVGILVDDAIVEIENIMRHLRMGKSPRRAAMEAANEIGLAVIATTFTLVAVFLPTAFMSGVIGRYFEQFGWTAAIAVLFSLVVARLLTPMMCAYLLRPLPAAARQEAPTSRAMALYLRAVHWCLNHRALTAYAAFATIVVTLVLVPLLPRGFLPADDLPQTQVTLSLPPGSTLDQTAAMAERARRLLTRQPEVLQVYTAIGGGAAGTDAYAPQGLSDVRRAVLTVTLKPRDERAGVTRRQVEATARQALADLPGVRVRVGMGASADRYQLVLTGADARVLREHARLVEQQMRDLPGLGAVSSSASMLRSEVVVRMDPMRAADLGVTTQALADTLRVATAGDHDPALPKLNLSERQVPVVVRLPAEAREDLGLLQRLPVPGARGPVPIQQVATLSLESAPTQIDRRNRQRQVTIEVELDGRSLGDVERQVTALPAVRNMPAGISRAPIGDAEVMSDLFAAFAVAMTAGVLCIYGVLVLLFRSFVQPATILVALVLAVPGAFAPLLLTRGDVSMPVLIGLIMLMGIAAKNSILLVDFAIMARREQRVTHRLAIMDACRKRAQPVIMTTLAMGAGMLPVALGLGASDPAFRTPMAIVVIGGLVTSTIMSLLLQVSPGLASARGRIARARAERVAADAAWMPLVMGSASASRGRNEPQLPVTNTTTAGVQASWELDFFGAGRAGSAAGEARLAGAEFALRAVRMSVAAETASSYLSLRACEVQQEIARQELESQAQTVQVSETAEQAGLLATHQVALARAAQAQAQAVLRARTAQCDHLLQSLVAITGLDAKGLRPQLELGKGLVPAPASAIPEFLPAAVLARRPDVEEAAMAVAAAGFDERAALARQWPTISLTGTVGQARASSAPVTFDGQVWSLGPLQITFPIFDAGVRKARVQAAEAGLEEAKAAYQARVRLAANEVEEALITLRSSRERERHVRQAALGFGLAQKAADERLKAGLASVLEVEQTRRSVFAARAAVAELQFQRAVAWVTLYRAAGGAWE
jgi:NodT family efflux transporter outer membrane factor (OMF) lipoprotein